MMQQYESQIKAMTAHFEGLVRSQLDRALRMEGEAGAAQEIEGAKIIGICSGDGIGPIISVTAKAVLKKLLSEEIASGEVILRNIEGLTLENRLAQGISIPPQVLADIKGCHVLLKGPTTTPQAGSSIGNLESANVTLRRELDLYANVRPVKNSDANIDWIFFRENTEGEYVLGSQGVRLDPHLSFDFKVTTRAGTQRIARAAFDYAVKSGKKQLSIVTKANIMKNTDGDFLQICREIATEYPDISVDEWYIDIMTANLLNPALQGHFGVVLLPNLYGDILTDEAAQLQGGVGTAGSANIGDRYAMFEAIHGSAPRMVADGLGDYANPSSLLRAVGMLLTHLGYDDKRIKLDCVLDAIQQDAHLQMTGDRTGITCQQFGDAVLAQLSVS